MNIILNAPNQSNVSAPNFIAEGKQEFVKISICNNFCKRERKGSTTLQKMGEGEMHPKFSQSGGPLGAYICASEPINF